MLNINIHVFPGLPAYDNVLVPRQKALQLCVEELRPQCDAIYDITIGYSDTTDPETGARTIAPSLAGWYQVAH